MKAKDQAVTCPYCGKPAVWTTNAAIYGRPYGKSHMIWWCKADEAYVGCHNNSRKPLGTMANKALRKLRVVAHDEFDPIWQGGRMTRGQAYILLKKSLGLSYQVHIGAADENLCRRIIEFSKAYKELTT